MSDSDRGRGGKPQETTYISTSIVHRVNLPSHKTRTAQPQNLVGIEYRVVSTVAETRNRVVVAAIQKKASALCYPGSSRLYHQRFQRLNFAGCLQKHLRSPSVPSFFTSFLSSLRS